MKSLEDADFERLEMRIVAQPQMLDLLLALGRAQVLNSRPVIRSREAPFHSSSSNLKNETRPWPQRKSPPPHTSLASFIAYANETHLSTSSTVYVGTYYEYLCAEALHRLGFTLTRTGGRSDAGIDLLGSWELPDLSAPLPCIVQCKNLQAKAGPNLVRELEGAFAGAPAGWRGENVVGVLCTGREATKGVQDVGEGVGRVRQLLWNQKVGALGAEGVGVGIRYSSRGDLNFEVGEIDGEVVLTWKGEVWQPDGHHGIDSGSV
ncbi:hypothetical protein MMC13_003111 [Lambiella insularis]|nr:hypothetical protein [Lambiella insularis]